MNLKTLCDTRMRKPKPKLTGPATRKALQQAKQFFMTTNCEYGPGLFLRIEFDPVICIVLQQIGLSPQRIMKM
jgi:hypothetical protein